MSSRELLLLRHAKSDWRTAESDFHRPLSKRGERDAPRVGKWLHRWGLRPDLVISSPAIRARQTACKVGEALGIEEEQIEWKTRIYDSSPGILLAVLAECHEQSGRVLLVGHNPELARLLVYLCGSALEMPVDGKVLPTATLARIGMPLDWRELQPDSGALISVTRPAAMDFPMDGPVNGNG
uniref:Phosphohistidine phosphatase n=1 Tax=Candidatus Kentrum sp. MB TaxID=2138164 RepID=A0A451BAP6_9GAMM|nr:MAG: phosphohistidine phosphatase [Candidatus Kentron sp. MB]VFK30671.1 MAG: phosphohistidine phosphatase [Candidatus Kentron sp. MB]VFK75353.1 MAG: phosphohistidine phosphatase [Candidatus Kentron sp. MB]